MNLAFKSNPGISSIDEAQGIVECFVAAIGNKDSVNDIVLPGAFKSSLQRRKPRVVWGHDWNHPIGKVLEIFEVGPGDPRLPAKMRAENVGGLYARVQFNLKSEKGREAFSSVSFYGQEQEWSIGYKTIVSSFDNEKQANLLKEVELFEVSPVLHGANSLTGTISVKSAEGWSNPSMGDGAEMARSLAEFMRSPVTLQEVKGADILFNMVDDDGVPYPYTTTFEINDGEYRFKRAQPLFESKGDKPGCDGNCDCDKGSKESCPCGGEGGTCSCSTKPEVAEKVGRVLSARNVKRLQDAVNTIQEVINAAGLELKELTVKSDNPQSLIERVSPVLKYHSIEHESSDGQVRFKGLTAGGETALRRAASGLAVDFEEIVQ